ncbi:MAG: sigma-70 family RNA polymerase sigma factor [Acidimicrobiales bacterium]
MADVASTDRVSGSTGRPSRAELEAALEQHRVELTGYCYRMLGSGFEAEDAVQETLVRAWRSLDRFEGRATLRSWLYRIATNVCFDMLKGQQRRARPIDLGPSSSVGAAPPAALPEHTWLWPVPDDLVVPRSHDPAEVAVSRATIRLAFVAALQHLPPRQRAVLILREVLRWKAAEVAELLGTSVASVNSALQRARSTLAASDLAADAGRAEPPDDEQRALLARYVDAFERFDIESLVSLLREDATLSMPPHDMWLQGATELGRWWLGPGAGCRGSRLVPVMANGVPAFAQYRPSGPGGTLEPFNIQIVEMAAGRISAVHYFLDTNLFPLFGLPSRFES